MSELSSSTVTIEAPAAEVSAILKDLESYPSWSTSIRSVEVNERDGAGNPTKVKVKVEAGPLKDSVSLNYDWSEAPSKIAFSLEDANLLTEMTGAYLVKDNGDETTDVTYQLKVAISMPVPDMMRRKQEEATIKLSLSQLKTRAEG
ncbi:MAG: SRPBCC family protein [Candidatus Nanopelagicaceae bacterium]|jgi:carbon monoxide dehydrogenase subunit G